VSDDFTKSKLAWLDQLVRDPKITSFEFCVAYVIASTFLNRRSGTAWPSHKKLAALINGKEEGVRAAIRHLVNAGYMERDQEARGRGHTNVYRLIHKNRDRHTGISSGGNVKKTGTAKPKNRDTRTEKPGSPSPQNPFKNPLNIPTDADGEAGSLATALPTGALARPPKSEQAKARSAVQVNNGGASSVSTQPNENVVRQRCEHEIAAIVGWPLLCSLPEEHVADLCRRWSEKKIGPEQLRVEVPNSATVAVVTPATGIVNGTDHAEVAKVAREKRPADCNRTELEAVHAEKARAEKRA
jgi:hypothetical protein